MALVAVLLAVVGSFMPWVHTGLGNVSGAQGPGLWTAYAAFVGLAGALLPWRRVAATHVTVFALVALVLPSWQVVHVLRLVGTGGWIPGTGLVLVLVAGILAGTAALRAWREA